MFAPVANKFSCPKTCTKFLIHILPIPYKECPAFHDTPLYPPVQNWAQTDEKNASRIRSHNTGRVLKVTRSINKLSSPPFFSSLSPSPSLKSPAISSSTSSPTISSPSPDTRRVRTWRCRWTCQCWSYVGKRREPKTEEFQFEFLHCKFCTQYLYWATHPID